jgi:hypothetical protein
MRAALAGVIRSGRRIVESDAQVFHACRKPRVFHKERIGKAQPPMRHNGSADRTTFQRGM